MSKPQNTKQRTIVFRADGGPTIGLGHFTRTLALAEMLNEHFHCIFATRQPTEYQIAEIERICHERIVLPEDDTHYGKFLTYLNGTEIVVLDNYYFTTEYQKKIRSLGCKVVFIDDFNNRQYACDALINNIPGFETDTFSREKYTKLYLGTDYALLRKEFLNEKWRHIKKKKNTIFISFGGSDHFNITGKIAEFLKKINDSFEINILIGEAFKHESSIMQLEGIHIHKKIPASEVALLMAEAEICIVSASSLLNEVSCIGSKALIGYYVENQIQPYNYFIEKKMAVGLENLLNIDFYFFKRQLELVQSSDIIISKQYEKYYFQQIINLKNIFFQI